RRGAGDRGPVRRAIPRPRAGRGGTRARTRTRAAGLHSARRADPTACPRRRPGADRHAGRARSRRPVLPPSVLAGLSDPRRGGPRSWFTGDVAGSPESRGASWPAGPVLSVIGAGATGGAGAAGPIGTSVEPKRGRSRQRQRKLVPEDERRSRRARAHRRGGASWRRRVSRWTRRAP